MHELIVFLINQHRVLVVWNERFWKISILTLTNLGTFKKQLRSVIKQNLYYQQKAWKTKRNSV